MAKNGIEISKLLHQRPQPCGRFHFIDV